MTTAIIEKNILRKDDDGHWYSIPKTMEDEFNSLMENIISEESGSSEWFNANDAFNDVFFNYIKID